MSAYFLGVDAGGTRTRAALIDRAGRELGRGEADGANPAGGRAADALGALAAAVAAALAGLDPSRVVGCLVALAGHISLPAPDAFAEECRTAFAVPCTVRLVPDAVAAFASGAGPDAVAAFASGAGPDAVAAFASGAGPDAVAAVEAGAEPGAGPGSGSEAEGGTGTVLIAGTGTVCVRLERHRAAHRTGGLGWLLGDEGSGFWLGRQAVRHAHADPGGALGTAVLAHCDATTPEELLQWAYAGPPRRLATLAPLVTEAAVRGDHEALALTDTAADHLAALVRATAVPGEPLVITGSVAATPTPVRDRLLAALTDLAPRLPATDAASAAALLARRAGP